MRENPFSATYEEARSRFRSMANAIGADVETHSLDPASQTVPPDRTSDLHDLTMDIASLGCKQDPTLLLSSGVHGIEGFLGSAIQLATLSRARESQFASGVRIVMIHAVNPFGFASGRRVNEQNVDLNRNFLAEAEEYTGASDGYRRLNQLLNPRRVPSPVEPFRLKAIWQILRFGTQPLKQAIACGQYEFPRGIFYGGDQPAWSTRVIQNHAARWLGGPGLVLHLDIHSGLGKQGTCKLLLNQQSRIDQASWFRATFGEQLIEADQSDTAKTAYVVKGEFGNWMQQAFRDRDYRFACLEFGTRKIIRVLAAIRAENAAHHHADSDSTIAAKTKQEMRECFYPSSETARRKMIQLGSDVIDQGIKAIRR